MVLFSLVKCPSSPAEFVQPVLLITSQIIAQCWLPKSCILTAAVCFGAVWMVARPKFIGQDGEGCGVLSNPLSRVSADCTTSPDLPSTFVLSISDTKC